MARKLIILTAVFLCCTAFPAADGYCFGRGFFTDLSSIESPSPLQTLDYHPVEIRIGLDRWADPSTFRAWLNGHDITDRFEAVPGGLRALVLPEDGLRYRLISEDPLYSKINLLMTRIKGMRRANDVDVQVFFVEYDPVEVIRDDKGVWFITGGSMHDVFEAMGHAVATDRLWQCETYRRSARGRLAEIFGPGQLGTDIFMRTTGYSDAELADGFESLDLESRIVIQAYVDGFNRRIDEIYADPSLLPFEFAALGIMPEYWSAEDILAWISLLLRQFDPEALKQGQLDNAALFQKLSAVYGPYAGYGMFDDLRWLNDPEALTYIPDTLVHAEAGKNMPIPPENPMLACNLSLLADTLADQKQAAMESLKKINAFVKMGSYAWVVSGEKTAGGNPILYSGPQMGFPVPSIVIEGSIRGGGLDISGMSVPGIPGIVIGRTTHHAWSMQVGHAHTVDYYFEDPSDPRIYLDRYETIRIAGQEEPYILPVFRSSHGPIINSDPLISWKYAHWGYEFDTIKAYLDLARAQSMDEFGQAIEGVAVSQHFCYADKDGNIAYWMSGRNPYRDPAEWRLPQGMLGDPVEWDASVLIERSTDRNTPQGYYCGWNNKTSAAYDDSYNNPSYCFGPFHRAHVIDDYLTSHDNLTFEEVRDLALNIATTESFGGGGNPWEFAAEDFRSAVETAGLMDEYSDVFDLLDAWDGHFVEGGEGQWRTGADRSDAWIFMDAWIKEVLRLTFEDELTFPGETPGDTTYDRENKNRLFNVLLHGLAGKTSGIVNTYPWYSPYASYDEIIVEALGTALDIYPLDEAPWGTGQRGTIDYRHDFLGLVHQSPLSSRSTYAHCVEFGPFGPERIESMFPLGESGNIDVYMNPDSNFFSMTPIFDPFMPRDFPVFEQ